MLFPWRHSKSPSPGTKILWHEPLRDLISFRFRAPLKAIRRLGDICVRLVYIYKFMCRVNAVEGNSAESMKRRGFYRLDDSMLYDLSWVQTIPETVHGKELPDICLEKINSLHNFTVPSPTLLVRGFILQASWTAASVLAPQAWLWRMVWSAKLSLWSVQWRAHTQYSSVSRWSYDWKVRTDVCGIVFNHTQFLEILILTAWSRSVRGRRQLPEFSFKRTMFVWVDPPPLPPGPNQHTH